MFATDGKTFRLLCILLTFMNQNIVEIKWFAKGQDLHKYRVSGGGTWEGSEAVEQQLIIFAIHKNCKKQPIFNQFLLFSKLQQTEGLLPTLPA